MTRSAEARGGKDLLKITDLRVEFTRKDGAPVPGVRGVSFTLRPGEVLALVGESGCGKSATALSLIGLLARNAKASGRIEFDATDLLGLPEKAWEDLRGRRIAMIFQDPMTALDPLYRVGEQIAEVLRRHSRKSAAEIGAHVLELLELVGVPEPVQRARQYPHQLSGGLRQRVVIAIALACEPELVIADEPTTALDVTIQAQIIRLLADLNKRLGMAMIFISHDLGVVSQIADRVAVMYAGQVVETGACREVLARPAHPYTRGLLASVPNARMVPKSQLQAIPGTVPALTELPRGCAFRNRCALAMARCAHEPSLAPVAPDRAARCWFADLAVDDPAAAVMPLPDLP